MVPLSSPLPSRLCTSLPCNCMMPGLLRTCASAGGAAAVHAVGASLVCLPEEDAGGPGPRCVCPDHTIPT